MRSALQPWPADTLAAHEVQRHSGAEPDWLARANLVVSNRESLLRPVRHSGRVHAHMAAAANFVLLRTALPRDSETGSSTTTSRHGAAKHSPVSTTVTPGSLCLSQPSHGSYSPPPDQMTFAMRAQIMHS